MTDFIRLAKQDLTFLEANDSDVCLSVWMTGCLLNCEGCNGTDIKPFDAGRLFNINEIYFAWKKFKQLATAFVVMGGNPPDKPDELMVILMAAKDLGYKTWVYTGYSLDQIGTKREWLKHTDYLKVGWYDESKIVNGYKFATSNQAVYRVNNNSGVISFNEHVIYSNSQPMITKNGDSAKMDAV